jgi:hypothetical protein
MSDTSIINNIEIDNQFLTNASVADAKHDFHNYTSILEYLVKKKTSFASGLPGNNSNYDILNEALTLGSVVKLSSMPPPSEYQDESSDICYQNINNLPSNNRRTNLYSPLFYFQDTNEKNKKSNFLNHNITTINDKRFNVIGNTALNLSDNFDRNDDDKYIDAKIFVDDFKIKHNSALVIDATAISILSILKKGEKVLENGEWFTIYIIDDLETRNDPAGKSSWSSKYDRETGVKIIFLEPDDPRVVSYIYNYDQQNPLNKFFTEYNFKLQTDINGEGCTLIITDKTGENVQINNPKEENAIEYVSSEIMKFLNNAKAIFKTNVKYQQKRSGDWLQVLLCLLLLSRTYKNSINNYEKYNRSNINNIYFMTHDRIALAYALFSGVDTLFTHGQTGTIMLFDLQKDPESLLISEFADCEIIMEPFRSANLEEIEQKKVSYKDAYDEKKNVFKNQIIENSLINELNNIQDNASINLIEFKNKIKDLFTNVFIFYSFCTELTPPENFKPIINDSLIKISSQIEQLKEDSSITIENKLIKIKEIKIELTELINNLKNIQQLCITDNVNKWQIQNNSFSTLISKLDFTGGGALTMISTRTLSSSVIKNTQMFSFLQYFPFLENDIQYTLNNMFYNFSFKVPTLIFQNYESSRAKEKPMIIIMSFCQEVIATFKAEPSQDMIMTGGNFETIFKNTSLYNLKYVVQEQNTIIKEKINNDLCHKYTGNVLNKRTRESLDEELEEDSDNMIIEDEEKYQLYKKQRGGNNNSFSYLNTERRKKILKYYLENITTFYDLNKLVLYMVGISMIHQLENENIYESLDYDTYKFLYEILLMFEKQNNENIYLANLFFGSSNDFEKEDLAIELSYQLGNYFNLNINNFTDSSHRLNLIRQIQTLKGIYHSNNLFNLSDYNIFYKNICLLTNRIGNDILNKIDDIESETEIEQGLAKGNIFAPPSPLGVSEIYGGKRRKKTIKKSKKSKKTRNNKKMIKLKTKKHGRRKHKFSIKKLK